MGLGLVTKPLHVDRLPFSTEGPACRLLLPLIAAPILAISSSLPFKSRKLTFLVKKDGYQPSVSPTLIPGMPQGQ